MMACLFCINVFSPCFLPPHLHSSYRLNPPEPHSSQSWTCVLTIFNMFLFAEVCHSESCSVVSVNCHICAIGSPVFGCPPAIYWFAEVLSIWDSPLFQDFRWQHHTIRGLTVRSDVVFLTEYSFQTIFYQCASKPEYFSYHDFKH